MAGRYFRLSRCGGAFPFALLHRDVQGSKLRKHFEVLLIHHKFNVRFLVSLAWSGWLAFTSPRLLVVGT